MRVLITVVAVALSVAALGAGGCREESPAMKKANLGRAFTERGDTARAIRTLNEAIKLDPELVMSYELLGEAHLAAGQHAEAITQFRETVRRDPVRDSAYTSLGCLLLATGGDLTEAETALGSALEINKTDSRSLACLGALRLEQRDMQRAVELSEQAISLNPQNVQARLNLGLAYMELGRTEEARGQVEKVIAWSQGSETLKQQAQMLLDVLSHPETQGGDAGRQP